MEWTDRDHGTDRWIWRGLALTLIVVSTVLHVAYLLHNCPLDLSPDEAHYWDWSRHLDWSYYSKGPLVALMIRGSCELLGDWSARMTGTQAFAVRLPAALCSAAMLLGLYVLAVQTLKREKLALCVVALALTVPIVSAGATLMTIDAPFTALWVWALVAGYAAIQGRSWAWPVLGMLIALGILAKYTMALWVASFAAFLLFTPEGRARIFQPGPWIALAFASLSAGPILYWNSQHEWVTFRHVGWQAGLQQRQGWILLGPLAYVAGQAGILLVFWFIAWGQAIWRFRPWRETRLPHRYLWWMSVPTFALFLAASVRTPGQLNWPITAYLSGSVLAAASFAGDLDQASAFRRRLALGFATLTAVIGLGMTLAIHYPELTRPVFVALAGPPTPRRPEPLRGVDPTCRLRGWQALAREVDQIADALRQSGTEPLLASLTWNQAGQLGFYGAGHPTVYCLGLAQGDRRSQYDFWRPNPIWDREVFLGRTFVLVGDPGPAIVQAFDSIDPPREVIYQEAGQRIATWRVFVARGFRGCVDVNQLLATARH